MKNLRCGIKHCDGLWEMVVIAALSLAASAAVAGSPPTNTSVTAATATAIDNPLCAAILPFYWEIGDKTGALASGSLGTQQNGTPVTSTTKLDIASAAKWIYGAYIVQIRGGVTQLTSTDVTFLHFASGYTNMGNATTVNCPSTNSPDTVNTCLVQLNPANGLPYDYQDPSTLGEFDYDAGHMENHASLYGGLGNVVSTSLGSIISAQMGSGIYFSYTQPLMAGGIHTSSSQYALFLRHILSGSLTMKGALGTHPICTLESTTCTAGSSPIPEAWHYSIGHWVENDPTTNGDSALSSPGALGFYPWIETGKQYYGVISRANNTVAQAGYNSAQCGRLVRHAWDTGIQQTGSIPAP